MVNHDDLGPGRMPVWREWVEWYRYKDMHNNNNNGEWMYMGDSVGVLVGGGKGKDTKGWRGLGYTAYMHMKTA
jgi:hypothetical protein